ncbi:hypothetical protein PRK78_003907 [Emydomyces testavorans]|uniref:Uncharacterized protein n=1 Tax=Emydomyces testavorans TaxID=2070801 RepID=A0AAF0IL21_9EURO|nr:hypothetical protein PRK78_003907 [Emydomyces testavorans]
MLGSAILGSSFASGASTGFAAIGAPGSSSFASISTPSSTREMMMPIITNSPAAEISGAIPAMPAPPSSETSQTAGAATESTGLANLTGPNSAVTGSSMEASVSSMSLAASSSAASSSAASSTKTEEATTVTSSPALPASGKELDVNSLDLHSTLVFGLEG